MVTERRRAVDDWAERIAVLEEGQQNLSKQHTTMLEMLQVMRDEQVKFKGVVGGVTLVMTGLATVFALFGSYISAHWK